MSAFNLYLNRWTLRSSEFKIQLKVWFETSKGLEELASLLRRNLLWTIIYPLFFFYLTLSRASCLSSWLHGARGRRRRRRRRQAAAPRAARSPAAAPAPPTRPPPRSGTCPETFAQVVKWPFEFDSRWRILLFRRSTYRSVTEQEQ